MEEDGQCILVIDSGSAVLKAGHAGDDAPRTAFPNVIGRRNLHADEALAHGNNKNKNFFVGDEAVAKRSTLALNSPMDRGIVSNWQDMEDVWHHTFYEELKCSPEYYNVIMTEAPLTPKPNREKITQVMFETFSASSLYVLNQAVAAQFASGYTSGVVVSSGDGVTHVVPIYYGHALDYATMKLDIGGRDLTEFMGRLLLERGHTVTYSEVLRDAKEQRCHVAVDFEQELQEINAGSHLQTSYELPDGDMITIGDAKIRCPEAMFQPSLLGMESAGVHELVHAAIMKCHENMRKFMYSNIVLAGGNTMFDGFSDRLANEMKALAGPDMKPKIIAPPERKYSPWIGASILGSLSTYPGMWIAKKEYEEYGPNIVHRKCY